MKATTPTYQAVRRDLQHDQDHQDDQLVLINGSSKSTGFKSLVSILIVLSGLAALFYMIGHSSTNGPIAFSSLLAPGSDGSASENTATTKSSAAFSKSSAESVTECSQEAMHKFADCMISHTLSDPNQLCEVLEKKVACFPECVLPIFYLDMVGNLPAIHDEECNGGENGHPKYFNQGAGMCITGDAKEAKGTIVSGATQIECQVKCMRDDSCTGFSHTVVNDFSHSDCYHYTEDVPVIGNVAPQNAVCYSTRSKQAELTADVKAKIADVSKQYQAQEKAIGGCHKDGQICIQTDIADSFVKSTDGIGDTVIGIGGGVAGLGVASGAASAPGAVAGASIAIVGGVIAAANYGTKAIKDYSTSCSDCCNSSNYWYGKAWEACGTEPRWDDGYLCGIGTTCNACKNEWNYWYSKAMTACGPEPKWKDGTLCGIGTTCKRCKNPYSYWYGKAMTACGQEPCWKSGSFCLLGTGCNRCCNGYHWYSKCK